MATSVCETLPRPIVWPATIDRTADTTGGIIPLGGFDLDDGLFCGESRIVAASIDIPVTVGIPNGTPIDYQVTSTLNGSAASLAWTVTLGGIVNAAGQLSGTATGTVTATVGALAGLHPSAIAGFAVGFTTAAGSQVTWGEPTLNVTLDNGLCPPAELGAPVDQIVSLCLPTVTVAGCDGTFRDVPALPTSVEGVVNVKVCPEVTLDWVPVFQCVIGDYAGAGVGGRDILDGEPVIANLLTDSSDGSVAQVVYADPQDPTFTLPESIVVGSCPTPGTITPAGCVKDTDGVQWDVFSLSDGTTFYVKADGTAGVPVGDPEAWGSCCDCVAVDNFADLMCEEEWPCPA